MVRNLIFTSISVALIALFPLLTQFYIRIAYRRDVEFLIYTTIVVAIIYTLKLLMDIHINKFENKFQIKLKSNVQERLLKHSLKKKYTFERAYALVEKKTHLYSLFVQRFLLSNFKATIRIVAVMITIIFFDINLFYYSLFFIPIFMLYLYLFHLFFRKNEAKVKKLSKQASSRDLTTFLEREFSKKSINKTSVYKEYVRLKSLLVEKEIRNRNSLVSLNQTLRASITFFRVLYLAYFGYFIISQDIHISGLIVGLLFLTILIRSFTGVLESMLFYHISKNSVIKLQKIL